MPNGRCQQNIKLQTENNSKHKAQEFTKIVIQEHFESITLKKIAFKRASEDWYLGINSAKDVQVLPGKKDM